MAIDFKDNEILIPVNQNQNRNHNSESAFFGSWSSSSFLTTSFGSELDSNEIDRNDGDEEEEDDDEFIAQLTRQMADYMLEEYNGGDKIPVSKDNGFPKPKFQEAIDNHNQKQTRRSYADTVKKSIVGFHSEQSFTGDNQLPPPIQMYKLENQPRVGEGLGRKGQHHRHVRGNKEYVNGGVGFVSTAAVGSGSRNVMSGTGVFLPRSATDATDHSRKKTRCSTVLIPTRVLQALEQHFNNMESLLPSNNLAQPHHNHKAKKDKIQTCESVSVDHQEPKLPQEWIY